MMSTAARWYEQRRHAGAMAKRTSETATRSPNHSRHGRPMITAAVGEEAAGEVEEVRWRGRSTSPGHRDRRYRHHRTPEDNGNPMLTRHTPGKVLSL